MTFDSVCRVLLFEIAKKHGLLLEEEPEYGGRAYLEKQDFIIAKQKEQLAAQERKLENLTMKIEDVEALIDEVAEIAYDKAVEVVTNTVKIETHKEDIRLVEQSKAWVLSPERKASQKECEYAAKRLRISRQACFSEVSFTRRSNSLNPVLMRSSAGIGSKLPVVSKETVSLKIKGLLQLKIFILVGFFSFDKFVIN